MRAARVAWDGEEGCVACKLWPLPRTPRPVLLQCYPGASLTGGAVPCGSTTVTDYVYSPLVLLQCRPDPPCLFPNSLLLQYHPDDRPTIDEVLSCQAVRARMLPMMGASQEQSFASMMGLELDMECAVSHGWWGGSQLRS